MNLSGDPPGVRAPGRRAHDRRTDGDRGLRRIGQIPRRRHDPDSQRRDLQRTAPACSSFIQQPYGVTLNFTPVVLSQDRIQLRVATEVTDIDYLARRSPIGDTSIPGFRTRKNETTVELPSGGSIASAGLISDQSQQAINGVPGLMNMPVLGSLFRSRDYLRQETELLIIVTPYIVHAIDPQRRGASRRQFQRRQRSAGLAARPRQPHLFELRRPATDARLFRPGGFHHRLTRTRSPCPSHRQGKPPDVVAASSSLSRPAAQLRGAVRRGGDSLAGCGVDYASNDSVPPGDYHDALSDRPRAGADRPSTSIRPAARLDQQSIDNIRAFAERYRELGDGRIAILAPAGERGRDARTIDQIRRALAGAGLRGYVDGRLLSRRRPEPRFAGPAGVSGSEGDGGGAMRPLADRPRLGRLHRGLEERILPEFRLRHPVDARRPGRRPARSRAEPRQRPRRRHDAAAGRSATCATAQIPEPTGRPSSRRSARSAGRLTMRAQAVDPADAVAAAGRHPANRSGAARLDPGVLRDAGDRGDRPGRDRRPTHGQDPRQAEHGRRRSGGRSLSQRADAQRHRARGDRQPRPAGRAARGAVEILRRRHQGHRARPRQRHRALPGVDGARRQRISRRAVHRGRIRPGRLQPVPRSRGEAARPRHRGDRRQGRRRRLDRRPQSRPGRSPATGDRRRSSPTSTSVSAPPGSTSTRIRRRASPKRCSRPSASTPI